MKQNLILLILLSATVCGAQSVPTPSVPTDSTVPPSNQPLVAPTSPNQSYPGAQQQPYTEPYGDTFGSSGNNPARTVPPGSWPFPRRVEPPMEKSEFETFAEDAAGKSLTVYGRKLFEEVPTTFAPMDQIPVPADYVIGPGDELMIRAWGKVQLQSRATVDRNGQIFIPKVGTLTVAGLRYDQLEGNIHSAIASLYKDFDLNVTMGQLRSLRIFVLGSARQPGVYTVSS